MSLIGEDYGGKYNVHSLKWINIMQKLADANK